MALAELARRDARRVAADRVGERGRRVVEPAAEAALDLLDQRRALVDERRVELDERRAGADLGPGGVGRSTPPTPISGTLPPTRR